MDEIVSAGDGKGARVLYLVVIYVRANFIVRVVCACMFASMVRLALLHVTGFMVLEKL